MNKRFHLDLKGNNLSENDTSLDRDKIVEIEQSEEHGKNNFKFISD